MKKRNHFIFFIFCMMWVSQIACKSEFTQLGEDIKKKAKSAWHGAKAMGEGLAQGFGGRLPQYKYNYRVFNDAPDPVMVVEFQLITFMGTRFEGKISKHHILAPMTNSDTIFYDRQLYFTVFICSTRDPGEIYKYGNAREDWAKKGAEGAPPLIGSAIGAFAGSEKTLAVLKKYKILEDVVYPWQPHDPNIYFYRSYADKNKLKGEFLDVKSLTDKFTGQFYNSSQRDVILQFMKDDKSYKVTIEKGTFNLLSSSDEKHSIRPPKGVERAFIFFLDREAKKQFAYIPIPAEGIAYIADSKALKDKPKGELPKPGVPMSYTYEIFELDKGPQVGLQGLAIGHYDQPVSGKIRDINPVSCKIWFKSADQVLQSQKTELQKTKQEQSYLYRPIDFLDDVWISYETVDSSHQKKLIPGQVQNFLLIRPQLSEKQAKLFVVSISSEIKKDTVQAFLHKVHQGKIAQNALYTDVANPLDPQDIVKGLGTNLHGMIIDDEYKIKAAIKIADTFYPQGVGQGPFYYIIEPDILRIDQFANSIYFDDTSYTKDPTTGALVLKTEIYKELYEKLPEWIKLYRSDKNKAAEELKNYLKLHAHSLLFKAGTKEFNEQGERYVEQLLEGPISLKNYPILRKAGINYYAYGLGKPPDNWPGAKDEAKESSVS